MVAAAQRAHLLYPAGALARALEHAGVLVGNVFEVVLKRLCGADPGAVAIMLGKADRYVAHDLTVDLAQRTSVDIVGAAAFPERHRCRRTFAAQGLRPDHARRTGQIGRAHVCTPVTWQAPTP